MLKGGNLTGNKHHCKCKYSFEKDKRVVITGAAGFLGGRAVYKMAEHGYKNIIATDIFEPRFPMPEGVEFSQMDISDMGSVADFFKKYRPHAVLNGAAIFSFKAPKHLLHAVNVNGPVNLLEAGYYNGLEHLVQISSGTIYKSGRMLKETSEWGPIEPYGESKKQMELELYDFPVRHHNSEVKITVLRPAVIYGPLEPAGSKYGAALAMFAQYAVAALGLGATAAPLGGGNNEACYVHVDDVVGAMEFVLENGLADEYNIVDQTPVTHNQLGQIVREAMGLPWYRRLLSGVRVGLPERPLKNVGKWYEGASSRLEKLGISVPLDEGAFTYMFGGDFSMSCDKLVSEGFVHKHPSSFRSMPPVIREYIENDWKYLVGPTTAKLVRLIK